jgi:acetyl-CoA acetyltransferase family protein
MSDPVVIVSVARTPIGAMSGELSSFAAHQLGAHVIRAAVGRAGLAPETVQEVIMGCVLPAGQGQAPARQAARGAGLPDSAGATTINKVCGSGMKAAMLAHDLLVAGSQDVIVAGGMESMSNAPYMMLKGRSGYRYGHGTLFDHMALDGLEDAYEKTPNGGGKSMGQFAEDCAGKYTFTREEQDRYAIASTERAKAANTDGSFAWEIAPLTVAGRKGEVTIDKDESPFKSNVDKIPTLKPAFRKDGSVTAATSSSISDGAAAMVMMRASTRDALAGAAVVHHRAGRGDRQALRQDRMDVVERRPVRDQRGLRRGRDGGHEGARPAAREGQRARRRGRARAPDRRFGRAADRHAAGGAAQDGRAARRRVAVHRRWRGDGRRAGTDVILHGAGQAGGRCPRR